MDLNQTRGLTVGPVIFNSFLSWKVDNVWTHIDHTQAGLADTAWYTAAEVGEERLKQNAFCPQ